MGFTNLDFSIDRSENQASSLQITRLEIKENTTMKKQSNCSIVAISPLVKRIDKIGSKIDALCLKCDLHKENLSVKFYKEFVKSIIQHELDNAWF